MWHVAVVDDQLSIRNQMRAYFHRFGEENKELFQLSFFENPLVLLNQYKPCYDLILMDIDMPHMSGMEAARKLRRMDEQVVLVFLTNLSQYAIDGYEVRAVDYVMKPLDYERFAYKIRRALSFVPEKEGQVLLLRMEDHTIAVPQKDLTYVEVEGHYVSYHTLSEVHKVRGTLKQAQATLTPPTFFMCNKCYLVNLSCVEQIQGNVVTVAGEEILISRPRKKAFMEALAAYHNRE